MQDKLIPISQIRVEMLAEAMRVMPMRCLCPECLRLDARYPDEGYQLALFPYRISKLRLDA